MINYIFVGWTFDWHNSLHVNQNCSYPSNLAFLFLLLSEWTSSNKTGWRLPQDHLQSGPVYPFPLPIFCFSFYTVHTPLDLFDLECVMSTSTFSLSFLKSWAWKKGRDEKQRFRLPYKYPLNAENIKNTNSNESIPHPIEPDCLNSSSSKRKFFNGYLLKVVCLYS